jgi:Family of unknown function (DUF6159)
MDAIWRGWAIAKASWTVLRYEPKLAIFPLFAILAVVAAIAGAIVVIVQVAGHPGFAALNEFLKFTIAALELLTSYLFCYFLVIFFNAALVYCALRHFDGGAVSVGEGLAAATRRTPQILGWAVIAATVGLVLKILSYMLKDTANRLGPIGSLIAGLFGVAGQGAWIMATFFVLPVMVVEGVGPITACRRSIALIKARWHNVIGGAARFGLLILMLALPVLIVVVVLGAHENLPTDLVLIPVLSVCAVYAVVLTIIFSTLGGIFLAAVYKFATTGTVPPAFESGLVQTALRTKLG